MTRTLRMLLLSGCMSFATVLSAVPAAATVVHECVSGQPTAASYTWDFKGEANAIFGDVRTDAEQALDHAGQLQSYVRESGLSKDSFAEQLDVVKAEVNDMGAKLCRLEAIRRAVAPWQQKEIDRIAGIVPLLADNTQDAILFTSDHPDQLWMSTYRKYMDNLYGEAQSLENSTSHAVAYASVSREYRDLRQELGMRSSS